MKANMSEEVASSSILFASTVIGKSAESNTKPFSISKHEVWDAYKRVKANKGSAGVDGQSLADFDRNLKENLYKLWNRLSSGSYFPPPVRRVEIPKSDGNTRPLGIPTVADRIAQMVVTRYLQPILEPHFHTDSFGYRPGKSAKDALGLARQRCWRYPWVLDLDIKGFFDTIDHQLLMRAIKHHTKCPWVILYIERWLKAPAQLADGSLIERMRGTPQGGVISPILANLYLHYAFDQWMGREFPDIRFERYADDIICHCNSERETSILKNAIAERFASCFLELHSQKTKIAHCESSSNRDDAYPTLQFDFLGYTFRPRLAKSTKGQYFLGFLPGISAKSAVAIRQRMRSWKLHLRTGSSLEQIARMVNPILRGWINYYGAYYKSALRGVMEHLDKILSRWAIRKYKSLKGRRWNAQRWIRGVSRREPSLFVHWSSFRSWAG